MYAIEAERLGMDGATSGFITSLDNWHRRSRTRLALKVESSLIGWSVLVILAGIRQSREMIGKIDLTRPVKADIRSAQIDSRDSLFRATGVGLWLSRDIVIRHGVH
jgi:hypothetical protein